MVQNSHKSRRLSTRPIAGLFAASITHSLTRNYVYEKVDDSMSQSQAVLNHRAMVEKLSMVNLTWRMMTSGAM